LGEKASYHLATLKNILDQVLKNPGQSHNRISLLQSEEYDKIVYGWNATEKEYAQDRTLHEMFEDQVEKTPDNISLVYEGEPIDL